MIKQKWSKDDEAGLSPEVLGAALAMRRGTSVVDASRIPTGLGEMTDKEQRAALNRAHREEAERIVVGRQVAEDSELYDRISSGDSRFGLSRVEFGVRAVLGRVGLRGGSVEMGEAINLVSHLHETGQPSSPDDSPIDFANNTPPLHRDQD